ncbi:hypothetical protein [Streptomyces sp. DSM 40750]|uniref:hypothetical protein n=1 Tax=Streptomyces sp. DSM 40750 TaxID=2801030 RepID=UPI00214C08DC|nr:hypothetical protein [Streptomyces sp. DSM 40750]UUU26933.1 hypothetical protein JIX55_45670 [Streptomyces sp. DSM 40750]
MSTLEVTVLDLDFPVGSMNKTATLVTGEQGAMPVDAGLTRANATCSGAEILDSGTKLTTVFVSHGDLDFRFGAEVIANAFPEAVFVATPLVFEHIEHSSEGKPKTWAVLGPNLPTRLVDLAPPTGELTLEGHRFELRGGPSACPTGTTRGRPSERRFWAKSCRSSTNTSGSPTPPPPATGPPGSTCWTTWPPSNRSRSSPATACPAPRPTPPPSRPPATTSHLRGGTRQGRGRCCPHRHPHQTLSRPRHADRRPDRRQGRQGERTRG